MKKIYKQPLTEVVKINAQQIICSSPDGFAGTLASPSAGKSANVALDKDYDDEDFIDELW